MLPPAPTAQPRVGDGIETSNRSAFMFGMTTKSHVPPFQWAIAP
jgi:hypothetical protein